MNFKNAALAIALLCLTTMPATPFGLGEDGSGFGKMGSIEPAPTGGGLTPCASTGVLNLSNVCNDIYFIGALK